MVAYALKIFKGIWLIIGWYIPFRKLTSINGSNMRITIHLVFLLPYTTMYAQLGNPLAERSPVLSEIYSYEIVKDVQKELDAYIARTDLRIDSLERRVARLSAAEQVATRLKIKQTQDTLAKVKIRKEQWDWYAFISDEVRRAQMPIDSFGEFVLSNLGQLAGLTYAMPVDKVPDILGPPTQRNKSELVYRYDEQKALVVRFNFATSKVNEVILYGKPAYDFLSSINVNDLTYELLGRNRSFINRLMGSSAYKYNDKYEVNGKIIKVERVQYRRTTVSCNYNVYYGGPKNDICIGIAIY